MDTAVFLARFLGTYCLVAGIGMALQNDLAKQAIADVINHKGIQYLSAGTRIMVGSFFVTALPTASMPWHWAVIIAGWAILLSGFYHLAFNGHWNKRLQKWNDRISYRWLGIGSAAIGVVYLYLSMM